MQMVTDRSLLIMVDHSKTLTLSKEFYQNFNRLLSLTITVGTMISLKMFLITYIESGASSASRWLVN